jgi:hypothetical protein
MATDLHDYSLSTIFSVSVILMMVASEVGRLLGARLLGEAGATFQR